MSHPVFDQLNRYLSTRPEVALTAFVARNADVIGAVTIGELSSVWYQTVVRADINRIVIGRRTNLQDACVLHVSDEWDLQIGDDVSCGHRAILHACSIGSRVLIGMGAVVMDGTEIGDDSIIGANALVTKGTKIPPGSLVLGSPARVIRATSAKERTSILALAEKYAAVATFYRQHQPDRSSRA
jgi:gamma-carbonic anhydrase